MTFFCFMLHVLRILYQMPVEVERNMAIIDKGEQKEKNKQDVRSIPESSLLAPITCNR